MEAKELRDMSADDLAGQRVSLREEIGHLKLKRATSRLENPMKLQGNQARSGSGRNDLAGESARERERFSMNTRGLRKERSGRGD